MRDVRARVAFYVSTPAYRAAFDHHGLGELADELAQLSRAQRWEEMPGRIDDDVLHTYATIGTWDRIGRLLQGRFGGSSPASSSRSPSGHRPRPRSWPT